MVVKPNGLRDSHRTSEIPGAQVIEAGGATSGIMIDLIIGGAGEMAQRVEVLAVQ